MSKIAFILRPANKLGEQGLTIKHSHGTGTPFTKSTGVNLPAKYYHLQTGKVVGVPNAPELNGEIQAVLNDVETAVRNCQSKGIEPAKAAVDAEYNALVADRAKLVRIAPKVTLLNNAILTDMYAGLHRLEAQVKEKKAEILRYELATDNYKGHLLSVYFTRYVKEMVADLAPNSLRIFELVGARALAFNPGWEITNVNAATLKAFEQHLRAAEHGKHAKGYSLNTILDTLTKLKSVVYEYAAELGIDKQTVRDYKTKLTRKTTNSNVVYLNGEEIDELLALNLPNPLWARVRDRFCVLALTGVRYSDSDIKREHVQRGNLVLGTTKTDTDIQVPLSDKVLAILERNDYNFGDYDNSNFNEILEKVCKLVPSLTESIEIKRYTGSNTPNKVMVPRYTKITSHVGRKSLINNALVAGVPAPAVASIVGHAGVKLVLNTYGSASAGKERIKNL